LRYKREHSLPITLKMEMSRNNDSITQGNRTGTLNVNFPFFGLNGFPDMLTAIDSDNTEGIHSHLDLACAYLETDNKISANTY
jgi:hypothetical protein